MMYVTPEEWNDLTLEKMNAIIDRVIEKAVEKTLLTLPECIGNMMIVMQRNKELMNQFVRDNPKFAQEFELLGVTMEEVEGQNPGISYEKLLKKVKASMDEKLKVVSNLNRKTFEKPSVYGEL